jgi:hypothetical protein
MKFKDLLQKYSPEQEITGIYKKNIVCVQTIGFLMSRHGTEYGEREIKQVRKDGNTIVVEFAAHKED